MAYFEYVSGAHLSLNRAGATCVCLTSVCYCGANKAHGAIADTSPLVGVADMASRFTTDALRKSTSAFGLDSDSWRHSSIVPGGLSASPLATTVSLTYEPYIHATTSHFTTEALRTSKSAFGLEPDSWRHSSLAAGGLSASPFTTTALTYELDYGMTGRFTTDSLRRSTSVLGLESNSWQHGSSVACGLTASPWATNVALGRAADIYGFGVGDGFTTAGILKADEHYGFASGAIGGYATARVTLTSDYDAYATIARAGNNFLVGRGFTIAGTQADQHYGFASTAIGGYSTARVGLMADYDPYRTIDRSRNSFVAGGVGVASTPLGISAGSALSSTSAIVRSDASGREAQIEELLETNLAEQLASVEPGLDRPVRGALQVAAQTHEDVERQAASSMRFALQRLVSVKGSKVARNEWVRTNGLWKVAIPIRAKHLRVADEWTYKIRYAMRVQWGSAPVLSLAHEERLVEMLVVLEDLNEAIHGDAFSRIRLKTLLDDTLDMLRQLSGLQI